MASIFDREYDLDQPLTRGLSGMSRASDASIPGQPSVPGVSRTVSRESTGPNWQNPAPGAKPPSYIAAAQNYGNEGRGIPKPSLVDQIPLDAMPAPDSNPRRSVTAVSAADSPVLPGGMSRAPGVPSYLGGSGGGGSGGGAGGGSDVMGIYAREAAIRGLDGNADPLARLNERPRAATIGNPDTNGMRDFQRFSAQADLSSMIHDLRTNNSTRALQAAGQLAAVQQAGFNAPEDQALRRAALAQQGDIAYRGQDAAALEADSRTKSVMALGRMKDATDRRGQDITSTLGLQRDATDRRGQDLTYGAAAAKAGMERYNTLLKGIDDHFVTTDNKPDLAAKASFLRQAETTGALEQIAALPLSQQGPAMAKLMAQHDLQAARTAADPNAPTTNQPLRIERGNDSIGLFDALSSRNPGLHFSDWTHSWSPFNNDPDGYAYIATPPDPATGTQAVRTAVPIRGLTADQRQAAEWANRQGK